MNQQPARLPVWLRLLPAVLFLATGVLMLLKGDATAAVFIGLAVVWAVLGLAASSPPARQPSEDSATTPDRG